MSTDELSFDWGILRRVGYVDVSIPAEAAGLSPAALDAISWRSPVWTDGDKLRAGAAAWFADLSSTRLVFDPVMAADGVLRGSPEVESEQQARIAERFETAGYPRESVDLVVLSHIEGIGMVAWRDPDGGWSPFFPNARVLVSSQALRCFHAAPAAVPGDPTQEAWNALIALGRVEEFEDGLSIAPGLWTEVADGHCAGHALLHFGSSHSAPQVSMLGHLAISPLHMVTGECAEMHKDPETAWSVLRRLRTPDRVLIGPLWPTPGFGRWTGETFSPGRVV